MNQLQSIPVATQMQPPKAPVKRSEPSEQDFSAALKKLVSQKEEQATGKQGAGKQEAAKEETTKSDRTNTDANPSLEETGTDEEMQGKGSSMELLQQLAAGMMMQMSMQTTEAAAAENAEQTAAALLVTAAVESAQPEVELPAQTTPQPLVTETAGNESLVENLLPKTGERFTVVQTDENGVPVEPRTAEAVQAPVIAEALHAESKTSQKVDSVPEKPEQAAFQTIPQPEAVKPQSITEAVKPQSITETEVEQGANLQGEATLPETTGKSELSKPQNLQPAGQETSVEGKQAPEPQVMEIATKAEKSEETEKPQQRVEMPTESPGTTSQVQQSATSRVESKVTAEPPKTVALQLADKLATFEATSKTEFQMQLFPEDLGEVTVKMAVRDGVMVIDILSPNSKTQQLLLANADDIKNMLQSQLQQRAQVVIPTEERPADYYHQQQEQSRHQQQEKDAQAEQNRQDNDIPFTGDFLTAFREIRLAAGLK